jgi:hypothetical protein
MILRQKEILNSTKKVGGARTQKPVEVGNPGTVDQVVDCQIQGPEFKSQY